MKKQLFILLIVALFVSFCKNTAGVHIYDTSILRIEMHLSAFGVESDYFPSIEAYIDFTKDSSSCIKSYYNPAIKGSRYKLSEEEIKKVRMLLQNSDLAKLKQQYSVAKTDQPTSTIVIYTNQQNFTIKDYGLEGDYPLPDLYRIVYKLDSR